MSGGWSQILAEGRAVGPDGRFPIRAYSEFMPPPWVGVKPAGELEPFTRPPPDDDFGWNVPEHQEAQELRPGLARLAGHVLFELAKLGRGDAAHQLSKPLLRGNPAWPEELAARAPRAGPGLAIALPLALSRTQDDKGRVRWTLFGASHEGPARPFWRSFFEAPGRLRPDGEAAFRRLVAWASGVADAAAVRVLPHGPDPDFASFEDEGLPAFARAIKLREDEPLAGVRALVTFRPFARLPEPVRKAYLAGALALFPAPESLVFWGHAGYRRLARELRLAMQNALLQLFPRCEEHYGIRIPQSGWLDETPDADQRAAHGRGRDRENRRLARHVRRTHRWQRVERDADHTEDEILLDDPVTVALFSTKPDDLALYAKPMARNVQVWFEDYRALLDGPRAGRRAIAAAERAMAEGGRFGYRLFYPPMRVLDRAVFWHRPLLAKLDDGGGAVLFEDGRAVAGFLTAERDGAAAIELWPRILGRPAERAAAELFDREPGRRRLTTARNVRKILEFRELLAAPLAPSFARRLIAAPKEVGLEEWLASLPGRASDPAGGAALAEELRARLGPEPAMGPPEGLTLARTATREFEERYWRTIASLCEGDFREKNNADAVRANEGRTGGVLAAAAGRAPGHARQLDALGDYLHRYYADLFARNGMAGRAFSADHEFDWETDFDFAWSEGWARNHAGWRAERNVVAVIPGRERGEAVIMADHYDTAYMEDLYDPKRGGDRLRAAAAGADDNHSATAALMLAAEALLPLAAAGRLARDVWLVHLTGEEFPSDCLGARALAERLVNRSLALRVPDGRVVDVSGTRVRGVYVLDMIAHNNDRDRDVFQIAPGEGRGAARLGWHAHLASERWNRLAAVLNEAPARRGRGRVRRMPDGAEPPPVAEHLHLTGEVRPRWDPRSALYNTDGQIFSDAGVPIVLFMENYDIRRAGYHDMEDTMRNIDLDYGAALAAIAIETVAGVAAAEPI
jgi:hypothetical protein